ncbi:MAG: error-prone DNA polymerase [Rhodoferax sp.]|nr:error-prone DNA polymerase [Rhodoferax sp.]
MEPPSLLTAAAPLQASPPPDYAELHCLSAFSFQRGASLPEELVQRAHALGYRALALTDECSVAGMVRAHLEAKRLGLQLLPGAEFAVAPAAHGGGRVGGSSKVLFRFVALAHDLDGWGPLCEFITSARRAAPKGEYALCWQSQAGEGAFEAWPTLQGNEIILLLPPDLSIEQACAIAAAAKARYGAAVWLGLGRSLGVQDALHALRLEQIAQFTGVPLVATGGVRMHLRSRKPLHDVLTAVNLGLPVAQCGRGLQSNAERHLRSRARLGTLFGAAQLDNTLVIASRCSFSLDSLRYHYPLEAVLPGHTPAQTLRQYAEEGARVRYPSGMPPSVRAQVEHELVLIAELKYEMYFLTVHDIVRFARSQGILCQGRGSAANSAVCYCLGVTEVDPARMSVLFERFISRERDEPPDIDVDFEHQRREEVIQYIYAKYGRERAAITAVVTRYRPRSALRDVGRALQIPDALIAAFSKEHPGMYSRSVLAERLESAIARVHELHGERVALPNAKRLAQWLELSHQLQRFPRHLSQHVGGFVLTQGRLTRLVPVENAAMPERSIIQWDKDDLDAVGLLKVDVLALGMLSAIHRCLDMVGQWRGRPLRLQDIPPEDPATYDMVCRADTVGVFQIESRAQMSMLPRLKPRCFYDLVVQVAIVRPGPIQGGMVHPYLLARANPGAVQYASPALEEVLKRTLGVPIFQEQVMQIAMAAANFSGGEADSLRRSMAAWKRKGGVHHFYDRLVGAMVANGYTQEFADGLFKQIEGFGEYGFPESHAASFALLVYVSCWLKRHEPACFLAAMLNSQPLGFYGPSQLVQDARRHGIQVRPADVSHSDWDCTLEKWEPEPMESERMGSDPDSGQQPVRSAGSITKSGSDPIGGHAPPLPAHDQPHPAIRLGLRMVSGLRQEVGQRIAQERASAPFTSTHDLALRCALDAGDLKALASADALRSLSGHRRQQVWDASALHAAPALFRGVPVAEDALALPAAREAEEVVFDYAATGLSLRRHPVAFLRPQLAAQKLLSAAQMRDFPHGRLARACGIVTMRQQPQTAKGVIFVTLEDETGSVNVIVWKAVKEAFRPALYRARLLAVYGVWQRDSDGDGQVRHLVAKRLVDLSHLLGDLSADSRDFH